MDSNRSLPLVLPSNLNIVLIQNHFRCVDFFFLSWTGIQLSIWLVCSVTNVHVKCDMDFTAHFPFFFFPYFSHVFLTKISCTLIAQIRFLYILSPCVFFSILFSSSFYDGWYYKNLDETLFHWYSFDFSSFFSLNITMKKIISSDNVKVIMRLQRKSFYLTRKYVGIQ